MTKEKSITIGSFLTGIGVLIAAAVIISLQDFMPHYTILASNNNFSSTYSSTNGNKKIGEVYGWYLVDTYGIENTKTKDNKDWWTWSYRRWKNDIEYEKDLSNEFKSENEVKSAFSTSDASGEDSDKALNKVCESVYKKDISSVSFKSSENNTNQGKLATDLLRYCSPLGEKPKTIQERKETVYKAKQNNFGVSDEQDLISVNYRWNSLFWKLRNDEFFGKDGKDEKGETLKESDNLWFHDLHSKKDDPQRGNIRDVCEKAYFLDNSGNGSNNKEAKGTTILWFCSWNKINNNN